MSRIRAALVALALALPTALGAQDRSNTILVLDASGSMWGQIDGTNKIVIAREVVDDLLGVFPAGQNLGLTVYGHRTRGDCSDIETIVAPGPDTLPAISSAVNAINPRGRTPMTDAIIAAAEALRYTEERATVILVSDGIETCNPDPCAAATALEEAGVDFTAHVVGFDVTDPEALTQMQCLAENTGGTFTTAANAAELSNALTAVSVAPEPVMVEVTFEARLDAEDGALVDGPVLWAFSPTPENLEGEQGGNPLTLPMAEGSYDLTAYWAAGEAEVTRQFIATPGRTMVVVFESPPVTASLIAPETVEAGAPFVVGWEGPNLQQDAIGITPAAETNMRNPHRHVTGWVQVSSGNPVSLRAPTVPGQYVIEYAPGEDRSRLTSVPLEVVPVDASLTAPPSVPAGGTVEIGWTGPAYSGDAIGITRAEETNMRNPHRHVTGWAALSGGNPVSLRVPTVPGQYVIEYAFGLDRNRLTSVPLEVTAVAGRLTAPTRGAAGSVIEVAWEGPAYERDAIGVTPAAETNMSNTRRVRTGWVPVSDGNPVRVRLPDQPGEYVIEYGFGYNLNRLVSVPITVE